MLVKTDVHQPVVATPAVVVDDAVDVGLAPDDGLQRGLGGVGDDLGVDALTTFEQTRDDGLALGFPARVCRVPAWHRNRIHRLPVLRSNPAQSDEQSDEISPR